MLDQLLYQVSPNGVRRHGFLAKVVANIRASCLCTIAGGPDASIMQLISRTGSQEKARQSSWKAEKENMAQGPGVSACDAGRDSNPHISLDVADASCPSTTMFRRATSRALKRTLTTRAGGKRGTIGSRTVLATGTGGLAATAAYAFGGPTHADAPNFYGNLKEAMANAEEQIEGVSASSGVDWLRKAVDPEEELISLVWGSNK
jgi:hypothetical protein